MWEVFFPPTFFVILSSNNRLQFKAFPPYTILISTDLEALHLDKS